MSVSMSASVYVLQGPGEIGRAWRQGDANTDLLNSLSYGFLTHEVLDLSGASRYSKAVNSVNML